MSSAILALIGDKLVSKKGPIDTSSLTFDKDEVLGLYFSAHWCGPCRGFTPKLAEFYKNINKSNSKLKIVFVSSDRSQENFNDYYGEMPWLALPFENADKKKELNRLCKVSGIPTLALFDSAGNKLKTEGDVRDLVGKDPEGKDFPWPQKPLSELLTGTLTDKDGGSSTIEDLVKNNHTLGIYFSAHWCPPCRSFTPQLVETYKKVKDKGHQFEIIFASSDRDEAAFKEYLATMPWKAIPLKDPRKNALSNRFGVEGIPTLVIISPEGKVITTNGRSSVDSDKSGDDFPWNPKPVNSLLASAHVLNDAAALVLFADGTDDEVREIGKKVLLPVAEKLGDAAMPDTDDTELVFIIAGGDEEEDMANRVRQFAKLPKASDKPSLLVILNIPDGECYVHDAEVKSPSDVQQVVDDFRAKKLTFRPLSQ